MVDRDQAVPGKQRLELSPDEEIDPTQQDRRHGARLSLVEPAYKRGLEEIRAGRFFEAHEELEEAWRAAAPEERDFFQGLVHVAVAWYQAGRGRPVATARQLEKAARRLAAFAPSHRGVDVDDVQRQVAEARERVAGGSLELEPPRV
jgi:predicted metal-dependent hydrolase